MDEWISMVATQRSKGFFLERQLDRSSLCMLCGFMYLIARIYCASYLSVAVFKSLEIVRADQFADAPGNCGPSHALRLVQIVGKGVA
jgi:hypothetical protein